MEWQGQSLDLDFPGLGDQTLHLRGWVQPMGNGWLMQLIDIADLLLERQQARSREACQALAGQISEQLRACSLARLPVIVGEQLQAIAQRWHIPASPWPCSTNRHRAGKSIANITPTTHRNCGMTASTLARPSIV